MAADSVIVGDKLSNMPTWWDRLTTDGQVQRMQGDFRREDQKPQASTAGVFPGPAVAYRATAQPAPIPQPVDPRLLQPPVRQAAIIGRPELPPAGEAMPSYVDQRAVIPPVSVAQVPAAAAPQVIRVTFEVPNFGDIEAGYHRIIRTDSGFVLATDTRFSDHFGPKSKADLGMMIQSPEGPRIYRVRPAGIHFTLDNYKCSVLFVIAEAPAPAPEQMARQSVPAQPPALTANAFSSWFNGDNSNGNASIGRGDGQDGGNQGGGYPSGGLFDFGMQYENSHSHPGM